jgi:hypothetical protein
MHLTYQKELNKKGKFQELAGLISPEYFTKLKKSIYSQHRSVCETKIAVLD